MKSNFCQLWLTCKDEAEADEIGKVLLKKRLIACFGKHNNYGGEFWWKGKIEQANETLLLMLSRNSLFDEIEREVAKLHSYDTFVLETLPIVKVSKKAEAWLTSELKNEAVHGGT